jgi:hypothetical protein
MDGRLQEELALQVQHGYRGAVACLGDRQALARDAGIPEVGGAQDSRVGFEHGHKVAMPPDVVPRRDDIGARLQETGRELGGEADAVRRVLAVDHTEVGVELMLELVQAVGDGPAACRAEDVADEEQPQKVPI